MRGKHASGAWGPATSRIIPAHAGQTAACPRSRGPTTDHPRACGANSIWGRGPPVTCGSSPRMRGKHDHARRFGRVGRIIPAHAGQTACWAAMTGNRPDHPRACGANTVLSVGASSFTGSSPRMRGKLHRAAADRLAARIIPAHAGQTVRFYAKTLERWTLNNWIRTVAPIFVLLFLPPVIGQNAYIERHYSNQSFSWFSKLHYASAFDLSLVA